MRYSTMRKFSLASLLMAVLSGDALKSQQQVQASTQPPTRELKVGARNSTIRNIGSLQADSALIFPKRKAEQDTAGSKALRRKGAFFYDSITHIVWFFDGERFRSIADSGFSIYSRSDSIREHRVVTIRNKDKTKDVSLAFKEGRVEIDTLLVRKRRLGLSTDTFMVIHNDTVRKIPRDSLWNIYTKDDSIRNTQKTEGKRTVYLQSKKLIFELGKHGNGGGDNSSTNLKDTGKIGIGQKAPLYTLDIATPSFVKNGSISSGSEIEPKYDSIAMRISHTVNEPSSNQNDYTTEAFTRYGLMLHEKSNKAYGRSAIGFSSENGGKSFTKARLWAQPGLNQQSPKFGIDVADKHKKLYTRMVIDSIGQVGIGLQRPKAMLHVGGENSRQQQIGTKTIDQINTVANNNSNILVDVENWGGNNYIRVQAGGTQNKSSGIWLTEHNNTYGFKIRNSAQSDYLDFIATNGSQQEDHGVVVMRLKALPHNRAKGHFSAHTPQVIIAPNDGNLHYNYAQRLVVHGAMTASYWSHFSDSALKEQVHSLDAKKSEQAILSLRPVSYYFKGDTSDSQQIKPRLQYGLIAQEIARSPLASLVSELHPDNGKITEKDGTIRGIKTLNYTGIIAPLVTFSQNLYRDKEKLNQEVKTLKEQVGGMQKQLAELQQQLQELKQNSQKSTRE